jgi:hypothetical protein
MEAWVTWLIAAVIFGVEEILTTANPAIAFHADERSRRRIEAARRGRPGALLRRAVTGGDPGAGPPPHDG